MSLMDDILTRASAQGQGVGMTTSPSTDVVTDTDAGERIAAVAGVCQAIMDFYLKHPSAPLPQCINMTTIRVPSRAELAALAGDFDQAPPADADCYRGAQFSVDLDTDGPITATAIFSFQDDKQ
jgi:hypothetical protein